MRSAAAQPASRRSLMPQGLRSRAPAGPRVGDGRHHVDSGNEFIASRSAFFSDLEVFAREEHANCYPYHVHDRWQLTWVLSGTVKLAHHGGSHLLHAGDAVLAAPLEPIAGRLHDNTPFGFVTMQIPTHLISPLCSAQEDGAVARVVARSDGAALCQTLIKRLMLASDGQAQREALDEAVMRFVAPDAGRTVLAARRARAHPVIERACSILDDALEEGLPLADLADAVQLNHRYVISLFNAELGLPPHQYFMSRRIDSARRMLNQGQPLNTVAAAAGYNDQSHLTRDFKRTFGVTPGAYQARHCHMNFLQNFPQTVS